MKLIEIPLLIAHKTTTVVYKKTAVVVEKFIAHLIEPKKSFIE
jgi:hypothetical protein